MLDKSFLVLKQEQLVVFNCEKTVWCKKDPKYIHIRSFKEYGWVNEEVCMSKIDIKMVLKFLPHIHTLVFEWCICKSERLLKVLDEIIEQNEQIRVKKVQITRTMPNAIDVGICQKNRLLEDGINWKIELFTAFLERCRALEILDICFEPDLCRNLDSLLDVTSDGKSGNAKLQTLNIMGVNREPFDCCSISDKLSTLSTVYMTWGKHCVDLIHTLSSKSASETNLKDLIVTFTEINGDAPSVSDEQWASFEKCQPNLKLKLVIVEDFFWLQLNYLECIRGQLADGTIPITKLTVICKDRSDFIRWRIFVATLDKVEELSWICYNTRTFSGESDFIFFYAFFCQFTHLKKLAFYGIKIHGRKMRHIASRFGRKLEDFVVVEKDISSFYPWASKSVLEQYVSTKLGRTWTFVKDNSLEVLMFWNWSSEKLERFLQKASTM